MIFPENIICKFELRNIVHLKKNKNKTVLKGEKVVQKLFLLNKKIVP